MDRRQRKRAEVGQQKCCPPLNPLSGHHSKAVVAATLSCKDSPPLLRYKRGCAAHGAAQINIFLLNRIALGAGPWPIMGALTSEKHLHRSPALCSHFAQRHHFAPLHQPHKNPTHFKKAANNNNKASALRLDALQNDGFRKENHIYTGCITQ